MSKGKYQLSKEVLSLTNLVYERAQLCSKLYDKNADDREFVLDIEDDVMIRADKNYMIQLLDNLVINSIKYCKDGLIKITVNQDQQSAIFTIADEGIGIPKKCLIPENYGVYYEDNNS